MRIGELLSLTDDKKKIEESVLRYGRSLGASDEDIMNIFGEQGYGYDGYFEDRERFFREELFAVLVEERVSENEADRIADRSIKKWREAWLAVMIPG
jgi:hypothetical protein